MSRKNIEKITPKIDFQNHFGPKNPSKIEEKSKKNGCQKNIRKKCEKSANMTPIKKPVLISEREARKVLKVVETWNCKEPNFQQGATRPAEAEAPKAAAASREKHQTAAEQCMHNGPWKPRGSIRELRSPQAMKTNPLRTLTSFPPRSLLSPLKTGQRSP